MKTCKYRHIVQPDGAFEVCKIAGGKVYRRLKCQRCKRATTNRRRSRPRSWLDEYRKTLSCERCGFADFRALEFHHARTGTKDFNVADMIRSGRSVKAMLTEIEKCTVLCSNCHPIEHYKGARIDVGGSNPLAPIS